MAQIKIGDYIPSFSLKDQNGNLFDINTYLGKKKLVIFFYPQDGSLNCTKEACYFRDLSQTFDEVNAVILGISGQSVESHRKFAETFHLDYPILSDEGDRVRKLFGVPSMFLGIFPGRVTYIADIRGIIMHIYNSNTHPTRHVDEALRILLLLKKTSDVNS